MKSVLEKILLTPDECQYFIDFFESDKCVVLKPFESLLKKTDANRVGTTAAVPESVIPKGFFSKLDYFNVLPFNYIGAHNVTHGLRINKYEQGQWMAEHKDDSVVNYNTKDVSRTRRWKSIIFQLSDTLDYSGGDLMLEGKPVKRDRGTVICFNADMLHSVTPVTSGARYSMILWLEKKDFNLGKAPLI